jgi:Acetyltransferase (GNAT) family.
MIKITYINANIASDMFKSFHHHQAITKKWVNDDNNWTLKDASDLREWDDEKRIWISEYLRKQIERGGSVIGAFNDNVFNGFCCVDGFLLGETAKYANLSMLFVDDDWKRRGIGKSLFKAACECAKKIGADKLFISAVPSFETIAFYFNMGCTDAEETISEYVDTDNDRYLEFKL